MLRSVVVLAPLLACFVPPAAAHPQEGWLAAAYVPAEPMSPYTDFQVRVLGERVYVTPGARYHLSGVAVAGGAEADFDVFFYDAAGKRVGGSHRVGADWGVVPRDATVGYVALFSSDAATSRFTGLPLPGPSRYGYVEA